MSRIIVKNLPKNIKAKKLQNVFSEKGCITDLQLKYAKDGTFRQFAFVGYKTEQEAQDAKEYFHNTYIDTSKIQVDICSNLGDNVNVKAWSKYAKNKEENNVHSLNSQDVTAHQVNLSTKKKNKGSESVIISEVASEGKEKRKKHIDQNDFIDEELQNDELFAEYMDLHKDRKQKPLWEDDAIHLTGAPEDSDEEIKLSENKEISDKEYIKRKVDSDSNMQIKKSVLESAKMPSTKKFFSDEQFTVKLRNLPYMCKKKDIKHYFGGLRIESLRIPPKAKGFAYVKFKTQRDLKQALNKHRGILGGRKIDVVMYERKASTPHTSSSHQKTPLDPNQQKELLADSGRLFIRNLCYDVTKEDVERLFEKYGPIADVHLPLHFHTKKNIGYGFITYMFAEHAAKAFSELDGIIFQGRLLHLMAAEPKKGSEAVDIDDLPFKKKKEAKLKQLSENPYTWNTLFLGPNVVADAMSLKYNMKKADLLSSDVGESIPVRVGFGETQLVLETRDFLLHNGVQLDAFSQPAAKRSDTVIIAKNLPVGINVQEIEEVFSKHGEIAKILLPPSGISALIVFQDATEAKQAFRSISYTRFHDAPWLLEWAPVDVFKENFTIETKEENSEVNNKLNDSNKDECVTTDTHEPTIEPEVGSTLFVKNLNFETTEESLRKLFKKCGPLYSVSISKKKNFKTGELLSMGFGFVQYKDKTSAARALQDLQLVELDGHTLELKFAHRATVPQPAVRRKKQHVSEQKSSKILVRNIPFEITPKEIRDLFKEFGSLKSVRLPKKSTGEGTHRGFGFVDFTSRRDAKKALNALCHSTHLLGRRLVLEWANPDSEDVSELRKKTARDFQPGGPCPKVKKSKLKEDVMLAKSKESNDND